MKIHGIPSLLLVLICISSIAQKNYIPGIVITTQGDTLKGVIDYRNWEKNPVKIYFKSNSNNAEEVLGVNQVHSFEIPGKDYYVSCIIWKDMQPVSLNRLESGNQNMIEKDTAFLRVLVRGEKLSLYQLIDEKEHYFINEGNDTLQELQYKVFRDENNSILVTTKNTFRDQLKKYTFNREIAKKITDKIDNASYRERELINIVTALNGNVDFSSLDISKNQKNASFFGGGGVSYNTMAFSGNNNTLNVLSFPSVAGYTVSAGTDVFNQRRFQNLFFRFELSYRSSSYKGTATTDGFYPGEKEKRVYDIGISTVNISASGVYTILKSGSSKLYAGAGGGYNFTSYPENTYQVTNQTTAVTTVKKNYLDFEKSWGEIFLRAGFLFRKHLEAGVITKIEGGFLTFRDIKMKNASSYFSVLYHF